MVDAGSSDDSGIPLMGVATTLVLWGSAVMHMLCMFAFIRSCLPSEQGFGMCMHEITHVWKLQLVRVWSLFVSFRPHSQVHVVHWAYLGHGVVQGRCLLLCSGPLWCKVEGLQQHVHVCQVVFDVFGSCHCLHRHCRGHGARSAAILPHECSRILWPLDHGNLDCDLVLHYQVFDYSLLVEVVGWYPEERRRGRVFIMHRNLAHFPNSLGNSVGK